MLFAAKGKFRHKLLYAVDIRCVLTCVSLLPDALLKERGELFSRALFRLAAYYIIAPRASSFFCVPVAEAQETVR